MDVNKNIIQKIGDWSIQTNIKAITLLQVKKKSLNENLLFCWWRERKQIPSYIVLKYE